jgi:glyoxylase-like metal-dependent hydrolase (beta-lactamase superfamily II)
MARLSERLARNADGELFVDASCIDCDACRQIAPTVFGAAEGQSYVHTQPRDGAERARAAMALVACPTASIGAIDKIDLRAASAAFPERVEGEVWACGYRAASSYGAASWLVTRPGGNLLVDSPRAARPLFDRIEALGGVALMFLTHRDDVADHAKFARRFGCERVLHRADRTAETAAPETAIERFVDGEEPIALADDLIVIPVPGHTRGSAALLYRERYLFTGDHLWWDEELGALDASRAVCWYSWAEQTRSMERLLDFRFEWVLPGHGRAHHAASPEAMRDELGRLVARMQPGRARSARR